MNFRPKTIDNKIAKPLSAPVRLLLVEDSPANQTVLSAMLRGGGHQVDIADSGTAAISAVRSTHYDMIFMDISMPNMNGMDTTRCIRQLGGTATIVPIIAITAHAIKGYREQCIAAGMNDYATKPISKKDLLALVKQYVTPEPITTTETVVDATLLNETVLSQLAEDVGMNNVIPLLRIFRDELIVRRDDITRATGQQNLTVLSHETHALKSGAATFGAGALHTIAVDMDACCKRGDLAAALLLAERLLSCAEATLAAIELRCTV